MDLTGLVDYTTDDLIDRGRQDTLALSESVCSALKPFLTDVLSYMENLALCAPADREEKFRIYRGTVLRKHEALKGFIKTQMSQHVAFRMCAQMTVLRPVGGDSTLAQACNQSITKK